MSLLDGFVLSSLAQSAQQQQQSAQQQQQSESASKALSPLGVFTTPKFTVPYIAQSSNKINFHFHIDGIADRQGALAFNTPPTSFHFLWRYDTCASVNSCWGFELQGALKTGAVLIKADIGRVPAKDYVKIWFDSPIRVAAVLMYKSSNMDVQFCDEDGNCVSPAAGGTYMLFDDEAKGATGKKLSYIMMQISGVSTQTRQWAGLMLWPYGDSSFAPSAYPSSVNPVRFIDYLNSADSTSQFKVQWYNARGGYGFTYAQYVASLVKELEKDGWVVWSGVQAGWQGGAVLMMNEDVLAVGGWANYPANNPTGVAAVLNFPSSSFWTYPLVKSPNIDSHAYVNYMSGPQAWDYWGATGEVLIPAPNLAGSQSLFAPLIYDKTFTVGAALYHVRPVYANSYRGTMFMSVVRPAEVEFEEKS